MFLSKDDRKRIGIGCALALSAGIANIQAQQDPGPRGGPAGAGSYYNQLSANEQAFFTQALQRFKEVDSVSGTIAGEPGSGLGPSFNGNSCAMCHAQPAVGGSSPGLASKQNPVPNPQVALATLDSANNNVPSFITIQGPVREARFVALSNQNNAPPDGGVHDLYTISGRTDASGCQMQQPDFATQLANNNVIFRIPTPLFGLGFVEATPDAFLQANLAANQQAKAALGIAGRLNTSGNDGTVTRFGWKAQNKSLLIFAGEAYNVEQGVSNEAFPNKRYETPGCIYTGTPDDSSNITNPVNSTLIGTVSQMSSDIVNFAAFIRLSASAAPVTNSLSEKNGQTLFSNIGCALCHSPSLTTGKSVFTGMSYFTYHPYSDFALHHMGSNLADGISQGTAGPDEFRTAPLWGVGQRLFFMHDGRTSDLLQAIEAHADTSPNCGNSNQSSGSNPHQQFGQSGNDNSCNSEADGVISQFRALSAAQKQDILNFLRSL